MDMHRDLPTFPLQRSSKLRVSPEGWPQPLPSLEKQTPNHSGLHEGQMFLSYPLEVLADREPC